MSTELIRYVSLRYQLILSLRGVGKAYLTAVDKMLISKEVEYALPYHVLSVI